MAKLRMGSICASIDLSIKDDSGAYAGAHRNTDQAVFSAACSPPGFSQCGSVSVVLHRNRDPERCGKLPNRIPALPAGESAYIAKFPGDGINRPGTANSNPGNWQTCLLCLRFQYFQNPRRGSFGPSFDIGWSFPSDNHPAPVIDEANRYLRAPDVDPGNYPRILTL
jgi:hypothetical protein